MRGWQALPSAVAGRTPAPGSRPVPTGAGYGGAAALPGMLNRKLQPRRRFQIKREATEERTHAGAEIKKDRLKIEPVWLGNFSRTYCRTKNGLRLKVVAH